MTIRVKYETLSGSVKRKDFDNWADAEAFALKKESDINIQWVDIYDLG